MVTVGEAFAAMGCPGGIELCRAEQEDMRDDRPFDGADGSVPLHHHRVLRMPTAIGGDVHHPGDFAGNSDWSW